MKSLITGGAGFIGSHLAAQLTSMGEKVIILDDFSGSTADNLGNIASSSLIEVVEGSILDQDIVTKVMKSVTRCYHLAASLGVERISNDPIRSLEVNLRGSEIVLNSASGFKVKTLLASSSEVYGRNPIMPLSEESDRVLGSPKVARWSYSEAKALDEFYAFELSRTSSFDVTIVRLFNTVGPRQSGVYGMVLPRFIKAAMNNEPLVVYGDGSQSRSFCAVSDVVVAMEKLMNQESSSGNIYNIGSTNEISILDLALKVIDQVGSKSQILFKSHSEIFGENFEEPLRRVPDITKISNQINWMPKLSLNNIIDEIVGYFKTYAT
jgi:UDP-glucose 4-epimerase